MLRVTLVAAAQLSREEIAAAADWMRGALADAGCAVGDGDWLDAAVLVVQADGLAAAARAALAGSPPGVDLLVTDGDAPALRLMVSDMDSTMISAECIDELADFAGIKAEVSAITERAMQGELDFEAALRARVKLLAGLTEDDIAACLAERVRPMPGAKTLVATLRAHGVQTILVSGGFHHFADPVGETIGFDAVVANRLEIADGRLTGELAGRIVDASVKAETLREAAAAMGIGAEATLALGDGANDIPMLQAAGLGIAYHAKPAAAAAADAHVAHGDLSAVLHAIGIARADWVMRD